MKKLIKKIADILLAFVAILGLINFVPIKMERIDLLVISVTALFLIIVIIITSHVHYIEKEIDNIKQKFIREKRLNNIEKEMEALKLTLLALNKRK